ncbi:hypothetical protein CTAYLR_003986 [Chrysophaeum taylorii]|uniref:non-specific serine/threonine protein kinase n=1 Tax=Chrysophaeum taylorii TaxID=2483200 RepID=A0AAD7U8L7_9STRA|nr:hypothetical protein CTAYLR_003986 [Chrysophaeum taylorii]
MGNKPATGTRRRGEVPLSSSAASSRRSQLSRKYEVEDQLLGEGHYGTVRACRLRGDTNKRFAVKTIVKRRVARPELLKAEVEIMTKVKHPNIIRVVDVFDEKDHLHIVTELCTGGELFDRIIKKSPETFSEQSAAVVLRQILDAVDYCHSLDPPIAHRDLKPENFLFKDNSDSSTLKVIDFGLSKLCEDDQMESFVGTPYYVAPEVISRGYTLKCDIWSIGVVAYILFCGYPPFYGDTDCELYRRISAGKFPFPSPEWDDVSIEAKELVRLLLHKDEAKRPTAREAMDHAFFRTHGVDAASKAGIFVDQKVMAALASRMRKFVRASKFKRLALNVLSRSLEDSVLRRFEPIFNIFDKDGDGKISHAELDATISSHCTTVSTQALLEGIDISGDGIIDFSEFVAATVQRALYTQEHHISDTFAHFDRDSKGHISLKDLEDITGSKKIADVLIKESGDAQKISYNDFKSIIEAK